MPEKQLPSLLERHWAESALAVGAVVIAAASLWVAIDANRTNRQLIAAASWPYVEVYWNDRTPDGRPGASLVIANTGIGPAKLETFELSWRGEPQGSPRQLLETCCGLPGAPGSPATLPAGTSEALETSTASGVVLRAGESIDFLVYRRTPADAASWDALRSHWDDLSFRYCYCSVFNDCWLSTTHFGQEPDLNPPRVGTCPRPKVPYTNRESH